MNYHLRIFRNWKSDIAHYHIVDNGGNIVFQTKNRNVLMIRLDLMGLKMGKLIYEMLNHEIREFSLIEK